MILAVSAMLLVVTPALSATQDCPTLDRDGIEKLLKDATSCDKSMEMFNACAYGFGGDTLLSEIVIEKCEGDFLSKLSKAEERSYRQKVKRCDYKYRNETGTMYRSFEAFCRAGVAQNYSTRALKAKPASRK